MAYIYTRNGSYNLFFNNCNNFSNDLSQILLGVSIPENMINLLREVTNSYYILLV